MNFEDEDYVRLYTRDTVTWELLGWEAHCVLVLMLRGKFDRAGIFVTGSHDLSRAVTAATKLPREVVEKGLSEILAEEIWVETPDGLVWPKYVTAQCCARTPNARKREERARKNAAESARKRPADVSQNVTNSHDQSHDVTPRARASASASASASVSVKMGPTWRPSQDRIQNLLIGGVLPEDAVETSIVLFRGINMGKTDSPDRWEMSWSKWAPKAYRANQEDFKPPEDSAARRRASEAAARRHERRSAEVKAQRARDLAAARECKPATSPGNVQALLEKIG